jgi:hypothetical protein
MGPEYRERGPEGFSRGPAPVVAPRLPPGEAGVRGYSNHERRTMAYHGVTEETRWAH